MGVPKFDSTEEDIKKWLNQIALICLSDEFQALKNELEKIYLRDNVQDVGLAAFQDALYAFLAEKDNERACRSEAH